MPVKLRTFAYFTREAFNALVRNSLMSLTATGIIMVALIMMGVFYILQVNMGKYIVSLRETVDIKVFLTEEINPSDLVDLKNKFAGLRGVKEVVFVSKEKGRQLLAEAFKLDPEELFSDANPLPDMFHLKLEEKADIDSIVGRVKGFPGVDEVYAASAAKMFFLTLQIIRAGGAGILVLIFFASVYIMINTIRLTVLARRREIEIMKLVGATNWFIRWPFLIEGLFLGTISAVIAIIILSNAYGSLAGKIYTMAKFIPLTPVKEISLGLSIWLLSTGFLIGLAGSFMSLKKFLKV